MDISALRYFAKVYECGSISKAARELYITPQGLSRTMGRLEEELGCSLFTRTYQGVVPTGEADGLYPKVCDLMAEFDMMRTVGADAEGRRPLRVAMVSGQLTYLGLDFVDAFESHNPSMELVLEDCTSDQVEQRLLSGDAQVGIMAGRARNPLLATTYLASFPYVFGVGRSTDLAERRSVSFSDLEGRTVFLLGDGYPVYDAFVDRAVSLGVTPKRVVKAAMPDTLLPLVSRGEAVAVGLAYFSRRYWESETLAVLPSDDPSFSWDVYLAVRTPSAQTTLFEDFAKTVYARRAFDRTFEGALLGGE